MPASTRNSPWATPIPALQRLANLTALHPFDLDYRSRRGAVNRQIGNMAETGRWSFLTEQVSAEEITAFERAFPASANRLRALRLPQDPTPRLGPDATARLAELTVQAKREGEPGLPAPDSALARIGLALGCGAVVIAVLAVIGLAVVGLVSLIW